MSTLNRYSQNLAGLNAAVFVSPAVAYTTDATLALFISNAVEGELGVFLSDNTLKSDALAAGDEFKIIQMRDGILHSTPLLKFDDITRKAITDYSAPAIQISSVGYSKTLNAGSLNIDLSVPGTQELVVSARILTPGNQPFPVEEGRAVSTKTTDTEYAKVREIVNDLNNVFDYQNNQDESTIIATIQSNGAQSAIGVVTLAIANGSKTATYSAAHSLSVGDFVEIAGRVYQVAVVVSTVVVTLDAAYTGTSETALATGTTVATHGTVAYTDGTTELGILLEGVDTDTHFSVAVQDDLENATIATVQAWALGAGDGDSISRLEREGVIFSGVGSTINAAFAADYGQPARFASLTSTYDTFFIELAPSIFRSAGAPVSETKLEQNIIIAAPDTGTTPTANLSTIFGL